MAKTRQKGLSNPAELVALEEYIKNNRGGIIRVIDNKSNTRLGRRVEGFSNLGDKFDPSAPVQNNVADYHLPKGK